MITWHWLSLRTTPSTPAAFQGRAIDLFVVFNHEAQTGHAVGNGGDVVDPADCRDYLLRQAA